MVKRWAGSLLKLSTHCGLYHQCWDMGAATTMTVTAPLETGLTTQLPPTTQVESVALLLSTSGLRVIWYQTHLIDTS